MKILAIALVALSAACSGRTRAAARRWLAAGTALTATGMGVALATPAIARSVTGFEDTGTFVGVAFVGVAVAGIGATVGVGSLALGVVDAGYALNERERAFVAYDESLQQSLGVRRSRTRGSRIEDARRPTSPRSRQDGASPEAPPR